MKKILPLFLAIFLSLVSPAMSGEKPDFHYYDFGYATKIVSYSYRANGSAIITITPIGAMGMSAHFNGKKEHFMYLTIEDLKKMRLHLQKAIKWSKISIEKDVDHEKDLGTFHSYKAKWSSNYNKFGNKRYVILSYSGERRLYGFEWELEFYGIETMEKALKTIKKVIKHYDYYLAYEKKRKKKLPPEMSHAEKEKLFQ